MSIILHCESCKKKIKAPDGAGGKYGPCPFCKHRCYIPLPKTDDEEELKLAPIDEYEEVEYKKKMAETHNLTRKILHVKETGGEPASGQTDERELTKNIIIYLRQIANGELDQAHDTAEKIVRFHTQAVKILDRIAISEIPEPELADIERPVLAGFIKNLRARLA